MQVSEILTFNRYRLDLVGFKREDLKCKTWAWESSVQREPSVPSLRAGATCPHLAETVCFGPYLSQGPTNGA